MKGVGEIWTPPLHLEILKQGGGGGGWGSGFWPKNGRVGKIGEAVLKKGGDII